MTPLAASKAREGILFDIFRAAPDRYDRLRTLAGAPLLAPDTLVQLTITQSNRPSACRCAPRGAAVAATAAAAPSGSTIFRQTNCWRCTTASSRGWRAARAIRRSATWRSARCCAVRSTPRNRRGWRRSSPPTSRWCAIPRRAAAGRSMRGCCSSTPRPPTAPCCCRPRAASRTAMPTASRCPPCSNAGTPTTSARPSSS